MLTECLPSLNLLYRYRERLHFLYSRIAMSANLLLFSGILWYLRVKENSCLVINLTLFSKKYPLFQPAIGMINTSHFHRIVSSFVLATVLSLTTAFNFSSRLDSNFVYSVRDNSSLSATLIAAANQSKTTYPTDDKDVEGLLYGDESAKSLDSVDDFVSPKTQDKLLDPAQIPAQKQPTINRFNPDNQLLEKTGQMFDDSGVLSDD